MGKKSICKRCLLIIILILIPTTSFAQIRLSKLISNGMVLQRNIEIPIWGWADRNEKIVVTFNNQVHTSRADVNGKWMIKLPPMGFGGPYQMSIVGKEQNINIKNILIGDVWVCSGQSNMEWTVAKSMNAREEITSAKDSKIRHFKIPRSFAEKPDSVLAGGEWKLADLENVGDFTAVGYFFAKELRKHINVPIGLINSSWGGSRIKPWMSADILGLKNVESVLKDYEKQAQEKEQRLLDNLRDKHGDIPTEDYGLIDENPVWADPHLNDEDWDSMTLPALWEQAGYQGFDGIAWYRKNITLSEEETHVNIQIGLGKIDDSDICWVNGQEIGGMEMSSQVPRVYTIPTSVLKRGKNVITVRVEDTGGGGGIHGDPELLFLKVDGKVRSLAGTWKFKLGAFKTNPNQNKNKIPTILYNKMIHPMIIYPIKGVLWYQGEANANPDDAYRYRQLCPLMIKDWRKRWSIGDFPFLFVQLANYMQPDHEPTESSWALLRESQSATLKVPNTAQAVIIDIGEADDIHPRNKQDVGYRLSLAARKLAYGENIIYSNPYYRNHIVEGNKVIIEFDHIGSGLAVKDKYGYVKGFAIAGADRKFVWAKAILESNSVIVWSEEVTNPIAVRYAWGNNPDDVNLYNEEGLPVSPFRTDEW